MSGEVLAGFAVKRFLSLVEEAPRCSCGGDCETRKHLLRELKIKDSRTNQMFAEIFEKAFI